MIFFFFFFNFFGSSITPIPTCLKAAAVSVFEAHGLGYPASQVAQAIQGGAVLQGLVGAVQPIDRKKSNYGDNDIWYWYNQ